MYYKPMGDPPYISSEQGGGLIMHSWLINYTNIPYKRPLPIIPELRAEEGGGLIIHSLQYCFTPHSRVAVVSKKFEGKTELTEPWYGAGYNYRKIDPRVIEEWSTTSLAEELHLPAVNEFIPTDFEIVPLGDSSLKVPTLIQVDKRASIKVSFGYISAEYCILLASFPGRL